MGNHKPPPPPTYSENLLHDIQHHIMSYLGSDYQHLSAGSYYQGLALSVRERLIERWLATQRAWYRQRAKRVYYLSMEFLPGRFLLNNIHKLQMLDQVQQTLDELGLDLEAVEEQEWDAGLGNGGLGRLASCYLDAMATLGIPGYGYGLRYDYGIFYQTIENGYQVERSDNWVRSGNPWEIKRPGYLYPIRFYGRSEAYSDSAGQIRYRWVDGETIMAMACDIPVPGYGNRAVNNMRLWAAVSSREFNLQEFNEGDYIGAVEAKVLGETISKVLYPRDENPSGKELRLKQQFFFVAATFCDIMRRFKKYHTDLAELPDAVAVQLNDTHPSIAVAELMRILLDDERLEWETAWAICTRTFAYTNHTVLPEALETWPAELLDRVLPRHFQIIEEINQRFCDHVRSAFPGDVDRVRRMSIIEDDRVRMAHLAIVGSHTVNGVSRLHSKIIRERIFRDFDKLYPDRFRNVTNGITPRRWLLQANPGLAGLVTSVIGDGWIRDLDQLRKLAPLAEDTEFRQAWRRVKTANKKRLARYIQRKVETTVDPASLFDVHIKRIHEYKRQLLNVLHVITRYHRIQADPGAGTQPRTVVFAGKAAPGYTIAKLMIKLIHSVAETVNRDPAVSEKLKVVFLPNYCVSQAEKIIPATDLSQQISTAGMEASGTGNMKFALNGALTIGTLDGANVEMREEIGAENMFIFGLEADVVARMRTEGYRPRDIYDSDRELMAAVDAIADGHFSPGRPDLFAPLVDGLLNRTDPYMVLADYRAYIDAQEDVDRLYGAPEEWARRSILNTAHMGKFSSDRAVAEYARHIWKVKPVSIDTE
jgi:starch phosphorylase